ncbi:hypothetical protein [Mucilaginibacter gotjawali]|uniref:Uncharacterized protein n=1 Tax=Mucilaginibacter gotjawali TaxID=1550579 RepID=A0A839SQL3_9SPHI|nr:hypothetical protein [Mucilaginibacter gotjawali]MBB3058749.1 hypothetical protein [Mucilaginibacter gotjawali]
MDKHKGLQNGFLPALAGLNAKPLHFNLEAFHFFAVKTELEPVTQRFSTRYTTVAFSFEPYLCI